MLKRFFGFFTYEQLTTPIKSGCEVVTIIEGFSDTFEIENKKVMVSSLITCSALIVSYQQQGLSKLYVAHLPSGVVGAREGKFIKELNTIAVKNQGKINCIYWSGRPDPCLQTEINQITDILKVTPIYPAEKAAGVIIDCKTFVVFGYVSSTGLKKIELLPEVKSEHRTDNSASY